MISNLKNLKGVKSLTKPDQKNVKGGQTCIFTISSPELIGALVIKREGYPEGPAGSILANDVCVSLLLLPGNSGNRCQYDCGWDGFGI